MLRFMYIPLVLTAVIASLSVEAMGQTPLAAPADSVGSTEPNPLPGLPRPPDAPASLLQPAPPGQAYACCQPECPYFQCDPRLDPADMPHPGWLFDIELGVMGSNVVNRLGETTPPIPGVGNVPMAALAWTVSPRFELGYRLPSGFGELDIAYRFLLTEGSGATPQGSTASPDADAALTSHLRINVGDIDYASNETSLGPDWDMKWRIGLRTADVFFDSQANEPFLSAQAGSGIFERSIANNYWGIGPHAALELNRRRNSWGLGWVGRLDAALLFGETRQKFVQASTAGSNGEIDFSNAQQAPMLGGFLGLDWRPSRCANLDILLGYTAEYWWEVGRISDADIYNGHSAGDVGDHGAVLRLEYNY